MSSSIFCINLQISKSLLRNFECDFSSNLNTRLLLMCTRVVNFGSKLVWEVLSSLIRIIVYHLLSPFFTDTFTVTLTVLKSER